MDDEVVLIVIGNVIVCCVVILCFYDYGIVIGNKVIGNCCDVIEFCV